MDVVRGDRELTVLVVDDDDVSADGLIDILSNRGIDCRSASGAHRAIAIVHDDTAVAVIVAKAKMQKMSGIEMIRHLERNLPNDRDFEALLVSDTAACEDAIAALQLGVADFLIAPLDEDRLVHAVCGALGAYKRRRAKELDEHQMIRALEVAQEMSRRHADFVSLVSHELRTPLAIIDAAAQRLIRRHESCSREEVKTRSERIRSAVARLTNLIDKNLAAARIDAMQEGFVPQSCDIVNILETVVKSQRSIARDFDIEVDLDGLPAQVQGSPPLLEQVFTNLVSNAVKYSPMHKHVLIEGREVNGFASVKVVDHGIGIAKGECDRVFEKFYRAESAKSFAGSGIGLHLCRHLVALHGGSIRVESEVGKGSTFIVKLPVHRGLSMPYPNAPVETDAVDPEPFSLELVGGD